MRVSVHGRRKKFTVRNDVAQPAPPQTRLVYIDDPRTPLACAIYQRAALAAGEVIEGPAILEDSASTVLLLGGDRASILESGEIIIDIGA